MEYLSIPHQESQVTTELTRYPASEFGEQSQYTASELEERTSTQFPTSDSRGLENIGNKPPLSRKELNDLRRQEKRVLHERAGKLNLDDSDEARCKSPLSRVLSPRS